MQAIGFSAPASKRRYAWRTIFDVMVDTVANPWLVVGDLIHGTDTFEVLGQHPTREAAKAHALAIGAAFGHHANLDG